MGRHVALHPLEPDRGGHVGDLERVVHQPRVDPVLAVVAHLCGKLFSPHRGQKILPGEKTVDPHP